MIATVSDWPFDPADPLFLADPYPVFDTMREAGGVREHEGLGMPVAVSHAACSAVLRHRSLGRIFSDATPLRQFPAFNLLHHNSLLENEPPTHIRLRRLVAGAFGRGHIQRLRPWVERTASALVSNLADAITVGGEADLLTQVAAPLPVQVIAELLGVPAEDRHLLQPWSNAIVKMYEYELPAEQRRAAERASSTFTGYLRELAVERAKHPGEDLITDLVAARDADGDRLSADELVATAALLLMAGHEASVNVVGNGVLALLRHPRQWRRLVTSPELTESCVEELIRYDSPLQLFERTATAEIRIAGRLLRPGDKIAALLGAAARDPATFEEPSALDIARDPNPHLGFGAGIHYCLGAPLARMEAAAILRALSARLPSLELAAEPERRPEFVIRGLRTLPVGHLGAPAGRANSGGSGAPDTRTT